MPTTDEQRGILPRLTTRVFVDLALWMISFGLLIGVLFPVAIILAGVPRDIALRPAFVALTVVAGVVVGAVNHALARTVVGRRLRTVSDRMQYVSDAIAQATSDGDWERCSPQECELFLDSDDELGDVARSFNHLINALADSQRTAREQSEYVHSMATHLDLADLSDATLRGMLQHSSAAAGTLLLAEDGQLRPVASHRMDAQVVLDSPLLLEVLQRRELMVVDVPEGLRIDALAVSFEAALVVGVPVEFSDAPVGVLVLAFTQAPHPDRLRLLDHLRDPTGVALHNALAHERFQRLAAIDPLTGAYNRRFGTARLREEYSRAVRADTPLGLLAFDLDHFKHVNDTFGHLAGDQVLREVVRAAGEVLRAGDVLVRTGGEEFLVILPGADVEDVQGLGERLRTAVGSTVIHHARQELRVTVSVGALSYPDTAASGSDELLEPVDRALYRAKQDGRDRTTVHRGPSR